MQEQLEILSEFFNSGDTRGYAFRVLQLELLKASIKKYEKELITALKNDLGKPEIEAYASEVGIVYSEINHALKELKWWIKPKKVKSPLSLFYSKSYIYHVPLGLVLIVAPWNYPAQLLLSPLVGAIAAGNCVVLKPSELTPRVAEVLEKIIKNAFDPKYILLFNGDGAEIVPELIDSGKFNHVFFTGSTAVGKVIANLCSQKLVPYTLELGGKSPAIVDNKINLKVTCKRIAWAKFYNAGQTCVAPDYILVNSLIKDDFVEQLKYVISELYPKDSMDISSIVNGKRFDTLMYFIRTSNVIFGGDSIPEELCIEPTLVDEPSLSDPIMQEEIFGPILPIISYSTKDELYQIISQNPNPLSLYIFSEDSDFAEKIIQDIPFGGGGVNIALMHLANERLPFGGVMQSGQGGYHGKFSFDTFSHKKSIVKMSTKFDAFVKYPPYTKFKTWLLKFILG